MEGSGQREAVITQVLLTQVLKRPPDHPLQASRRSSCCAAPALLRRTAAGATAALLAAQAALPALAAPDLALGATVFANNCAVCHQGGLNNIAGEEKHTLRRDAMVRFERSACAVAVLCSADLGPAACTGSMAACSPPLASATGVHAAPHPVL